MPLSQVLEEYDTMRWSFDLRRPEPSPRERLNSAILALQEECRGRRGRRSGQALVRDAIVFWNQTLGELRSGFRLARSCGRKGAFRRI
jgi:hypothetical protein